MSYIFVFPDYDGKHITSYIRFLANFFAPIYMFSVYCVLYKLQSILTEKNYFQNLSYKSIYITSIFISLILGTVTFYQKSTLPEELDAIKVAKQLEKLINVHNQKIMVINQEGVNFEGHPIQYHLKNKKSNLLIEQGSFAPSQDNPHRFVINENDLLKKLESFDIIIIFNSDKWLDTILSKLTNQKIENISRFVLIKEHRNYILNKF